MKKICFYTGSMKQGGAERDISLLANYLVNQGFNVSIVLTFSNKVFFNLDERIELIDFSKEVTNRSFRKIKLLKKKIRELHESRNFDYYVCNMIGLNFLLVSALNAYSNSRVICRVVSDPKSWPFYKRLLARHYYKKCYKTILQTEYQGKALGKIVFMNSVVIPNVCDYQIKIDKEKNFFSRDLVYIGRLNVKVKKINILIEGFSLFLNNYPNFKLHLYGEYSDDNGYSKKRILASIKKHNLQNNVLIHKPISNVMECINDSFAMLFSSPHEGMPNALLEAYVVGLPIVTSDFSGSECIFKDNFDALIYRFGKTKEIRNKLSMLLENHDLYNTLSENSSGNRLRYSEKAVMSQWVDLFR